MGGDNPCLLSVSQSSVVKYSSKNMDKLGQPEENYVMQMKKVKSCMRKRESWRV